MMKTAATREQRFSPRGRPFKPGRVVDLEKRKKFEERMPWPEPSGVQVRWPASSLALFEDVRAGFREKE